MSKGFFWKLVYDPLFVSAKKRAALGLKPWDDAPGPVTPEACLSAATSDDAWRIIKLGLGPISLGTAGPLEHIESSPQRELDLRMFSPDR